MELTTIPCGMDCFYDKGMVKVNRERGVEPEVDIVDGFAGKQVLAVDPEEQGQVQAFGEFVEDLLNALSKE